MTYYFDGGRVGTIRPGITQSPMYLMLSNGVDAMLGGPLQSRRQCGSTMCGCGSDALAVATTIIVATGTARFAE